MIISIQSKFKLHRLRRDLLFVSSMCMLLFSLFSCIFVVSVEGASLEGVVHVGNEYDLRSAINNAGDGVPTVIALDSDISLAWTLNIPASKIITLTSSSDVNFFKLFSAYDQTTIIVESRGMLTLDGIIVTHVSNARGNGVVVQRDGVLVLSGGEIFGNIGGNGGVYIEGGGSFTLFGGKISGNSECGVYNNGRFTLSGGKVSNNNGYGVYNNDSRSIFTMSGGEVSDNIVTAPVNAGGGVYNSGTFTLSGGLISGSNVASGVYSLGIFTMSGGEISGNNGTVGGGASIVGLDSTFTMSGGSISNNRAYSGGGVYVDRGVFDLSGGKISGNTANEGGGVCNRAGIFTMSGGEIYNSTAGSGGGVYNTGFRDGILGDVTNTVDFPSWDIIGNFTMSKGTISNNKATNDFGGGVYNCGNFILSGGEISSNTAPNGGGGVYLGVLGSFSTFDMKSGSISDNSAKSGGGVYVADGLCNVSGGEISGNTATGNGGGIWVTATDDLADFEKLSISNGVIFSSNRASVAYTRISKHDDVYAKQIGNNVAWSGSFTQGYNNYDISYTSSSPVKPEPSVTVTTPHQDTDSKINWLQIIAVIIVVSIIIIAVMVVKKKREPQQKLFQATNDYDDLDDVQDDDLDGTRDENLW